MTSFDIPPTHAATLEIDDKIYIPVGLKSDPRFLVPEAVVELTTDRYELATPGRRGIDPMCGIGTMPRIIQRMGGKCDAIEIDSNQYTIARSELSTGADIKLADCLTKEMGGTLEGVYDYVYTSVPFLWFKDYPDGGPSDRPGDGLRDKLGPSFRRMLKRRGILIIDCDDIAVRDGRSWPLAKYEIDYFTQHGFRFDESTRFSLKKPGERGDSTFTEIKFTAI